QLATRLRSHGPLTEDHRSSSRYRGPNRRYPREPDGAGLVFDRVVELYRASLRPEFDGSRIVYAGPVTGRLHAACVGCAEIRPEQGLGQYDSGPDTTDNTIEFEWRLGANEHGRFYGNIRDLIVHA